MKKDASAVDLILDDFWGVSSIWTETATNSGLLCGFNCFNSNVQTLKLSGILGIFSIDWFKGKSTGNHGFYHQI